MERIGKIEKARTPLLFQEVSNALRAGKHAFKNGYRHAVNQYRDMPHDPEAVERFLNERYRLLPTVHPLATNGFISRIGHYNHWCRRNDWTAVSRDIANLHLGGSAPDKFAEAFADMRHRFRNRAEITFEDNVGSFHWPDVLSQWDGVMDNIVEVLCNAANKPRIHISANKEKEGNKIVLAFRCSQKPRLNPSADKTLTLVEEVVGYFRGSTTINRPYNEFHILINLPNKIRVDHPYGGRGRYTARTTRTSS